MDNVPQLSALSHHREPPPTWGPAVGGCCPEKEHCGKEKRRGVPCGLPASEWPSHLLGKCERMLEPSLWWCHQGVLAFSGGDRRAAMGAEAGGSLRAAASEYHGAVSGPAEELLPAAVGSGIHLHPFPEAWASRPHPAWGAALPPSQGQRHGASGQQGPEQVCPQQASVEAPWAPTTAIQQRVRVHESLAKPVPAVSPRLDSRRAQEGGESRHGVGRKWVLCPPRLPARDTMAGTQLVPWGNRHTKPTTTAIRPRCRGGFLPTMAQGRCIPGMDITSWHPREPKTTGSDGQGSQSRSKPGSLGMPRGPSW